LIVLINHVSRRLIVLINHVSRRLIVLINHVSRRLIVLINHVSTRREPPTMGKQLVNFITCGCESSAPFFVINKVGREPTPYW
jgi:hypothetical protein